MKIITRSSKLALAQVDEILSILPSINCDIIPTASFGDKNKDISLLTNTKSNFFTEELDNALLEDTADIAIHSAKDLPYPMPQGLEVICLLDATDKTDSLISINNLTLNNLPTKSKIGTSSIIRKEAILKLRPDLEIVSIRGTIEERIALVDNGTIDALIVASCALKRLNLAHRISEVLPFPTHPLQGNLAIVAKTRSFLLRNKFATFDIRLAWGKVFICGFGAGSHDLLTIRAHNVLQKAAVIYYDDLIEVAHLLSYNAEKIYVGKRKGKHAFSQDEINEMLYQSALTGKQTVRLKGGDPMIFGRGGEELDYLRERLVDVEVVPGISAAMAASAYGEIPLTYRNQSTSVALCTAYPIEKATVPNADTLVYYMGASEINDLAKKIIHNGRDAAMPVALIQNASHSNQKVLIRNLEQLATGKEQFESPLISIIGKVVDKRTGNNSLNNKLRVWVTGTDASMYREKANVLHMPLVAMRPIKDVEKIEAHIHNIKHYNWIIFTSKYAVNYFFEVLHKMTLDARIFHHLRIASIGRRTSLCLKQHGIIPDIQAKDETSNGIIKLFNQKVATNILIPRSNIALDILPKGLKAQGHKVDSLKIYENYMPTLSYIPDLNQFDIIVFSSPSGVHNFRALYLTIPEHLYFIPRGAVTKQAIINELGDRNIIDSI